MKRPAFQFYPADWRNNAKLRRCSPAARGVWMDVLCLLHDADEYGALRWPLKDIVQAAGAPLSIVRELIDKGVLKGADKGAEPYVFTPRHAGKDGEPALLLDPKDGPCWYSSRFVRDEWIRQRRGSVSQFTTGNQPPKRQPKATPIHPIGERQGDGPSSSSSSSSTRQIPSEANASGGTPPDSKDVVFALGVPLLTAAGVKESNARSFLAMQCKAHGERAVADALEACSAAKAIQPIPWLQERLKPAKPNGKHAGFSTKDYREGVTADGSLV